MDFSQIHVLGVVFTLIAFQILKTSQHEDSHTSKASESGLTHLADESVNGGNQLVRRERRFWPALALGTLGVGLGLYGYHKWKEYHPCRYYNWGLWEAAKVKHHIKANDRCRKSFEKVRDKVADAGKCTNIARAECVKVNGDRKCAAVLTDGSVKKLSECV